MDAAPGDLLCQWDDDDLHHHRRLEVQADRLLAGGADAVLLRSCFHLLLPLRRCYRVDWGRTRYGGHPATIMRRRAPLRYQEEGPFDDPCLRDVRAQVEVAHELDELDPSVDELEVMDAAGSAFRWVRPRRAAEARGR